MDITELITSLGFPAAVAAFALWNSYKHEEYLQNTLTTTIESNTAGLNSVKEAIILLKDAVNNLNEDMQDIVDKK